MELADNNFLRITESSLRVECFTGFWVRFCLYRCILLTIYPQCSTMFEYDSVTILLVVHPLIVHVSCQHQYAHDYLLVATIFLRRSPYRLDSDYPRMGGEWCVSSSL